MRSINGVVPDYLGEFLENLFIQLLVSFRVEVLMFEKTHIKVIDFI